MNCRDVRPLLTRYVDSEADSYEQTLIEQHLTECQICSVEVSQLRLTRQRVQRELKSWAASAVPAASARERLLAKLAAEKTTPAQVAHRHKPLIKHFDIGITLLRLVRYMLNFNSREK